MKPITGIIFLLNFLGSCQQTEKNKSVEINNSPVFKFQNNDWKNDVNGCLGLRTLELAEQLIKDHKLLKSPIEEFYELFGKPNEISENNDKTILIYFTENNCQNGLPVQGADKCWIQFEFDKNRLAEIPKVFACE